MVKQEIEKIRNFCIIAHIDHGKSTLADRFLELTHTISDREKREQILDSMDLERERGITIKMQPVTMRYQGYTLNLIDTPGHVDFSYEVSRALAAVEGAILLVDATQGIQAQTLANLYLALEQNLTIIPVLNKIDLKAANLVSTKEELSTLLGVKPEEILAISAKFGTNVELVLQAVVKQVPSPVNKWESPDLDLRSKLNLDQISRAIIFDSYYDQHRGVVCDIRVFDGGFSSNDQILFYQTAVGAEIKELGIYTPGQKAVNSLQSGEIGYLVTGIREPAQCEVGDTIIKVKTQDSKFKNKIGSLPGYKKIKPMVFANIYPKDQSRYLELGQALEELKLNDAALYFEPASSLGLGKGFKLGVLGLLHLDIVEERIFREHGLELVLTVPQVEYRIKTPVVQVITSPPEFPENSAQVQEVQEPWVKLEIITPDIFIGDVMQIVMQRRGEYVNTEFIATLNPPLAEKLPPDKTRDGKQRAILSFKLPLAELLTDFYDKLKSVSAGFASLNYELADWRSVDLVKITFLVAGEEEETLSILVPRDQAYTRARQTVEILKKEIPPHLFEIRLQAKMGGRIIASECIKALRKNVTAKLYGGDVTRKLKLLKKQKKGKKKMAALGRVNIPNTAYLAVLRR